ncbi:MAG: hypothetical protein K2Y08_05090 [Alphaproteobacteria bacterium]|nr:hypothetical protein [Alphaproteobacteria bacterium]
MKTSWNQMIVLGSAALFFTAYTPQNAEAQSVNTPEQKKELLESTNEMKSLVPEESTLTSEEETKLRVEEENVFDEQVPG